MSSIWEEMTGIKSHTVDEVREAVDKAVAEAQPDREAVASQRENAEQPSASGRQAGQPEAAGLAAGVATMDAPAPVQAEPAAPDGQPGYEPEQGPEQEDDGLEAGM